MKKGIFCGIVLVLVIGLLLPLTALADKNDDKMLKKFEDQYELVTGEKAWRIGKIGPMIEKAYADIAKDGFATKEMLASLKAQQNILVIDVYFEGRSDEEAAAATMNGLVHPMNAQKLGSKLTYDVYTGKSGTGTNDSMVYSYSAQIQMNLKKAPKYLLVYFEGMDAPTEMPAQFYLLRINGENSKVLGGPFLAGDLTLP